MNQDDDGAIAPAGLGRGRDAPGCIGASGLLLLLHGWMTVNVTLGMGPLIALLYAFVPPYVAFSLVVAATEYWRLGLPALLLWLAMLAGAWRGLRRLRPGPVSLTGWGLLLPVLLVWMPLLSCELVRAAAMHHALRRAQADCHHARPLRESIRDANERYRLPHAWMIKDSRRHLWSYGEMDFVPDSRPPEWGGGCRR